MASPERYIPAVSVWPYTPVGEEGTHASRRIGHTTVNVKLPTCYRGYVYYWSTPASHFMRKPLPSHKVLEQIWAIGDALYDRRDVMGMEKSKAAQGLNRLVFDLRTSQYGVPTAKQFALLEPAAIERLREFLQKLKYPPTGVEEQLERLAELRADLTFLQDRK